MEADDPWRLTGQCAVTERRAGRHACRGGGGETGRHTGRCASTASHSDSLGVSHALNYPVADTLAEVEALTLGDTPCNAQALVDTLADTLAEAEAMIFGDSLGDAHERNDPLADTLAEVEA